MSSGSKYLKALAKRIDGLRQDRGLSYNQMALACDMDKAQVYALCTKGTNITVLTALKLAEGLEINVQELFDFRH
jgi:transcriptional regulator with XRE-family HTH domain